MFQLVTCVLFITTLSLSKGAGSGISVGQKQSQGSGDTDTTKILRIGATIPLYCKLETDKHVDLKWFKDGEEIQADDRINFENSTLIITEAEPDDIGQYYCKSIYTDPPQSFYISVITLSYKRMPKSATVFQGDRFQLHCEVDGDPYPDVEWFKDHIKVEETFNSTQFLYDSNDNGVPNATLIITSAEYVDRGEYMCFISSHGVILNTTTFVRVKDMYAALWPFIGIVAEVVILCFIIFVYEKNRLKNDLDESDTDQPADQRNVPGSNQDSLRQRK